jgi:hypothetical protein
MFLEVVIATLAAMPSAYAGVEAAATGAARASLSDPVGSDVVLAAHGTASPTPEDAPTAEGAFFSPFTIAPAKHAHREPKPARDLSNGSADLTYSIAASLAAVAAFAYALRRAVR